MSMIKGLETTFNSVYTEYDKWRPTYVKDLYDDIFDVKEINPSSNVLEVGIGTGQATLPILKTGCSLTAIELGDQLAEFSKHKFKDYDKFNVKNFAFQDFECPPNSFDLIFSASAFHWIPEDIGYTKVFDILKSEENAKNIANIAYKYGFIDVSYTLYHRTRTFTADEYTSLLGTYSDHIAIEETTRMKFFDEIREAINDNGGIITIYDTIDLQLARKP
ncbi:methyltransferase domain-containing protein [Clostridium sp.]|uniref:class I SAM-dependent methyltransferase n=1 Tax=Clostridium sp. TaxID=1506 RepID=UPI003216E6CE